MTRGVCWHPDAEPRDKGVEDEILPLLTYSAALMDDPGLHACETGAFPGTATQALRAGLYYGTLASFEIHGAFAEAHGCAAGTPDSFESYGLTFLDSSPYSLRDEEFGRWWATARRGAVLLVHDVLDDRWRKPWPRIAPEPLMVWGTTWGLGMWRR